MGQESLQTVVFKFVGLRPAQLATEAETKRYNIRDVRADTAEGKQELVDKATQLAHSLSERRSERRDRRLVPELAQGAWDLVEKYLGIATMPDDEQDTSEVQRLTPARDLLAPDLVELLGGELGKLEASCWDSLYATLAEGPKSASRLQVPMAALQLLHFMRSLKIGRAPSAEEALKLLRSNVLLSPAFKQGFHRMSHGSKSGEPPQSEETEQKRSEKYKELVENIVSAQDLLEQVTQNSSPSFNAAPAVEKAASPWDSRVRVSTVAMAKDVIPEQINKSHARVLKALGVADTAPAPQVAELLRKELTTLISAAQALEDDAEFRRVFDRTAGMFTGSSLIPVGLDSIVGPLPFRPFPLPEENGANGSDVDMSGKIKILGLGDLKVVKQKLLAYVASEVAHIENVLSGEKKERNHRRLDRTEVTIFEASEEQKESERDNQSTDRFELKAETQRTLKENSELKAGLSVTGRYGPIETTASGEFVNKTSKEESAKSSSNYAREVVTKSVDKIQTKIRSERTTKTITEVEEINAHSLNGSGKDGKHTVGIYRWVDKKYQAQVYNYGQRWLLEFVVSEPSAYYRATKKQPNPEVRVKEPPTFRAHFNDSGVKRLWTQDPLGPDSITEFNYARYAALFEAGDVSTPPPMYSSVSTTLATPQELAHGKTFALTGDEKFAVPTGYRLLYVSAAASTVHVKYPKLGIQIQDHWWEFQFTSTSGTAFYLSQGGRGNPSFSHFADEDAAEVSLLNTVGTGGQIPVGVVGYDLHSAVVAFQAICKRTPEEYQKWQMTTYKQLLAAWQAKQTAYETAVAEARARLESSIMFQGQNPGLNKVTMEQELKKLCIIMMTGDHLGKFNAVTEGSSPELDPIASLADGRISQFFEQAFEWEQMTYLFYPYFWGKKKRWKDYQHINDPDPQFQDFLNAGAARVVVPVPLAYGAAVRFLLDNPLNASQLADKVWGGGELPGIDDDLYRSISEELRDRTDDLEGADPEGKPWEFRLPTTLVWLQQEDTLPTDFE